MGGAGCLTALDRHRGAVRAGRQPNSHLRPAPRGAQPPQHRLHDLRLPRRERRFLARRPRLHADRLDGRMRTHRTRRHAVAGHLSFRKSPTVCRHRRSDSWRTVNHHYLDAPPPHAADRFTTPEENAILSFGQSNFPSARGCYGQVAAGDGIQQHHQWPGRAGALRRRRMGRQRPGAARVLTPGRRVPVYQKESQ